MFWWDFEGDLCQVKWDDLMAMTRDVKGDFNRDKSLDGWEVVVRLSKQNLANQRPPLPSSDQSEDRRKLHKSDWHLDPDGGGSHLGKWWKNCLLIAPIYSPPLTPWRERGGTGKTRSYKRIMEIVIEHWNRFMVSRVVLEPFCIKHGSLMIMKMVQMEPLIFFLWPKTASETAFCSEGVNNGGNSWRGWVHHQLPYLSCSHRKKLVFITLLFYSARGAKKNDMTKEIKLSLHRKLWACSSSVGACHSLRQNIATNCVS